MLRMLTLSSLLFPNIVFGPGGFRMLRRSRLASFFGGNVFNRGGSCGPGGCSPGGGSMNFGNMGGFGNVGGGKGSANPFAGGANPFGGGAGGGAGGGGGGGGSMMDRMLEWCSISHAQDIARRMGLDLKNIRFNYAPDGSVTVEVEATNATPAQIEALGEAVMQECPVAKLRNSGMLGGAPRGNLGGGSGGAAPKMKWIGK